MPNVPGGKTVAEAFWQIKDESDDPDAEALLSKRIDLVLGADGLVVNAGAGGTAQLEFYVQDGDLDDFSTSLMYRSAVKVILSDGSVHTPRAGLRDVIVLPPGIEAVS